jgi:hypothetical protein
MYKSIKNNIWKVDQNAKNTLEDFRQKIKLDQIWPPPITHIINCIHHMQTANYSASQSDLNFSNKMHEYVDYTQSFAVQKFLAVVSKTNKGNDVRKQITISLVKQIIEALPTINSSYIKVITKLPNSEQSYKGKVKTHNYINRQNQSTTGKL